MNNNTGTTVSIGISSTNLIEFKLPAGQVFNLAQSYITYQYTIAALANNYAFSFENNQDLCQWIYFGDGGGLGICDLNYCDRYTSVIMPLKTSQTEMETRDISNTLYVTNQINTQNVLPFSQDGLTTGTTNSSADSMQEPQYLRYSTGPNTALTVTRVLPLSSFKDTFVGLNKDSIFARDMYLRMNTQFGNRLGFYSTGTANPNVNATAINATNNPAMSYTNVALFLAIEENSVICSSLRSALAAGSIKYKIPYTYTYRLAGTGSASNMSITITRQFGHKLKRMLYSCFSGSETSNYSFDHSNVNGTKIATLQSSIDSRPLTDYALNCLNPNVNIFPAGTGFSATTFPYSDDYMEMSKYIRGSSIPSQLSYQINWHYADCWGIQPLLNELNQNVDNSNINDGLNILDADHVWTIQATTPAINTTTNPNTATAGQIVHYVFALYERNLHVSTEGISFS
jgi:hypothetical protein